MTRRSAAVIAGLLVCAEAAPVRAHRLDEYLQTARLAVEPSRVGVELALTPGASMAPGLVASIDADGDGRLSDAERAAYVREVWQAIQVTVDDRAVDLVAGGAQFPAVADMTAGVGVIRLQASAAVTHGGGRHHLAFANAHRDPVSVYLVNALAPEGPRVRITGQSRDVRQRSLRLDYEIDGESPWTRAGWLAGGLGAVCALVTARRGRTRRRS